MTQTWIILGATSSMARAFAREMAEAGATLVLAGRDIDEMKRMLPDLAARGAEDPRAMAFDARDPSTFGAIVERVEGEPGEINVAVFVGSMPSQAEIDADPSLIEGVAIDNFTGPAQFLARIVPVMESRASGNVVGVSSVAGDRGRIGNYVYGAAKAGFSTYLSGLRNRLTRSGGHVVTVKPGFTDTSMTWGVEGMFLVASPEKVARDIAKAVRKRRNVIYTPGFWWVIMTIIKLIPERIFKKLSI
jgi:short-subunit dehydrogenase